MHVKDLRGPLCMCELRFAMCIYVWVVSETCPRDVCGISNGCLCMSKVCLKILSGV